MPDEQRSKRHPARPDAPADPADLEERVLVFAPLGRDGSLITRALDQAALQPFLCTNAQILYDSLEQGAGAILLTIEALHEMNLDYFATLLDQQAPWSDLPVVLLVSADIPSEVEADIQRLGNITLLERPVRLPGLLSAVKSALRARRRQYEVRELLAGAVLQQAQIQALNERLQRSMTETHHRVKNSLQIIAGMIDLQVLEDTETLPTTEFVRLGSQVRMLAVVHDLLTQQAKADGLAQTISAKDILERLLPLLQATAGPRHIRVLLEDTELTARQATSLALVVNELVSNALKYGHGEVEVSFQVREDVATLEVCDDGPGFAPGFEVTKLETTGLGLVENLSRWDLKGSIRFENRPEGGARVSIRIPVSSLSLPT
ncbi:MAG TPA: ATP-binding protein [Chthonomonadaceae bacterium]|nr:ATP-binding protein [Chthonomonadaceae bacterium]